eukprot:Transcript_11983.p1 GENE.Transcript_11983~~Transcript_11983.p1  ORF type:complete len:806 (+),score=359.14 Transcript_11983:124-2418(+)
MVAVQFGGEGSSAAPPPPQSPKAAGTESQWDNSTDTEPAANARRASALLDLQRDVCRRGSAVNYGVKQQGKRFSIQRRSNENLVEEVDVPHEIIDVLANNMPRLLQLVSHWSKKTGEVTVEQFERVLHTLGVRYTPEQVERLFKVLDADDNNKVSLEELLLLKSAIDNDVTELPARPSLEESERASGGPSRNFKLKISHDVTVERKSWGFFQLLKPILGAIWKADLRAHHALDYYTVGKNGLNTWQTKGTAAPPRPRERYTYDAKPVGPTDAFTRAMQEDLALAAEHACAELGELLSEVRQMDLKLEEVRLIQGNSKDTADIGGQVVLRSSGESLSRLKHLLAAFHHDVEECLISQTRYTRSAFHPPELVGCPRTVRYHEELVRAEGHTRWRRRVAVLAAFVLMLTYFLYFCILVSLGKPYFDNHRTCEFQHFACTTRSALYRCADGSDCADGCPDGQVVRLSARNLSMTCDDLEVFSSLKLDWAEDLLGTSCDPELLGRSYVWCLPLPLLFVSSVVLPIGLFRNNAHRTTVIKVLVWTPVVPLILIQCLVRASILLSIIPTAYDRPYAQIIAAEGLVFAAQVAIFLFMDAMRHPTPLLRIGYALFLCIRFGTSLIFRTCIEYPAEQWPLLEPGPLRDAFMGAGSNSKQNTIASIDWTITLMLFSSILSVINYPGEMAVVRLRCDTKAYFNWRDRYIGAMNVRAHRRDLDAADSYLWWRSKADRCKEKVQRMLPGKRVAAPARGNAKIPTEATPVMEGVTLSAD